MLVNLQIFGILFAVFLFYLSYASFRKKDFNILDFILWGSVSFILIIVIVFYKDFYFVFDIFHIEGALWFLTIGGMFFLFVLIFILYRNLRRIQKKIEGLVRYFALKSVK